MKSRIILLALFLVSITGKIEWWGRELMCPDADELLRYLEGVSRTNYARASLDDSKEVTTFARFGQRCVNCEAASSPPSLSTPASTSNVKGNETRVNEGSTRRGWRGEKCAARRGRRERRGALKVTIFLRSKVMARNCRHRRNDRRRKILVYRRRPFADKWRWTFERQLIAY